MEYYFLINERLKKLCKMVSEAFSKSPKPAYFEHTLRVANYCYQIGLIEGVNLDIMIAAALIHDIGRVTKPSFYEHVIGTKEEGPKILLSCGYDVKEVDEIMNVSASHHPAKEVLLSNIYEQILFDADNLESVGVFGILRWYVNISGTLDNVISDANMYIDNFTVNNRENFFYTKYARAKGEHLIKEGIDYAYKVIAFCEASIKQDDKLMPIGIDDKK